MADQPIPLGDPEGALTPEEAAAHAEVAALLGSLDFLKPDGPGQPEPMPDDVWTRLESALAAQAPLQASPSASPPAAPPAAEVAAPVVPIRRGNRWVGGLVAASVAIVAVGIGVTVLRPTTSDSIVAGESTTAVAEPLSAGTTPPSPVAAAADENVAAGATEGKDDAASAAAVPSEVPAQQSPPSIELRAEGEPAARVVLASSTNYTPADLPGQVSSLFASMGVDSPEEAMAMPITPVAMPVADGFTASWQTLRDCVTWLTGSTDDQALIVDRALFQGTAAGVVVAPGDPGPALGEEDGDGTTAASPAPTVTLDAGVGMIDVWVVDSECTKSVGSIREYLDYRWQE